MFLFLLMSAIDAKILTCCNSATFLGRTFKRQGSRAFEKDEVPMYISVGSSENNGNLMQILWEINDSKVVPTLQEVKTMMLNEESTVMTEEVARGEEMEDGAVLCPDEIIWEVNGEMTKNWTCSANDESCEDQIATCPVIAPQNKCTTLGRICCKTCQEYKRNMTMLQNTALPELETTEMPATTVLPESDEVIETQSSTEKAASPKSGSSDAAGLSTKLTAESTSSPSNTTTAAPSVTTTSSASVRHISGVFVLFLFLKNLL